MPTTAPIKHKVAAHWYISASGMGALVGHIGPSIQVTGRSGVLFDIVPNLGLKLGVGGGYGPFGEEHGYTVDGWSIFGEAEFVLRLFDAGFQMGPVLGLSGGLQSVRVKQNGLATSYKYPKADATLGLNFNIPVYGTRTGIGLRTADRLRAPGGGERERLVRQTGPVGGTVTRIILGQHPRQGVHRHAGRRPDAGGHAAGQRPGRWPPLPAYGHGAQPGP